MSDSIFAISRSGLDVERERMQVIAQNLANAGTTSASFKPMRLVSGPKASLGFAGELAATSQTGVNRMPAFQGTQVYGLETYEQSPRQVYEPGNPHADSKGFVSYPGIDHAGEMALMVQTLRVYEANVVMFNAGRSMYMRAMDLGAKS